jgi:hypothetical protein
MNRFSVMAGFIPAIHVLAKIQQGKTWMPGTSPGMTDLSRDEHREACLEILLCLK